MYMKYHVFIEHGVQQKTITVQFGRSIKPLIYDFEWTIYICSLFIDWLSLDAHTKRLINIMDVVIKIRLRGSFFICIVTVCIFVFLFSLFIVAFF